MDEFSNPYQVNSLSPTLNANDARVTFPLRALVGSLLVMLPWPLFAIAACSGLSLFDKSSEAIVMFGSATMIILLPLAFFTSSEWVFGGLAGAIWLLVLVLPLCFSGKSIHPRFQIALVFAGQSIFAAIQAGLGFLIILGKQC